MKFLSLFSGIGGFDLGFERAGMECVGVCEIDKQCQSVLRRHFPNAVLFDDVRKVGKATHERGSIDVICGGFPCQDLSIAGKRAGLVGERSGLWFEFARVIDELEPRWVVIENVPGLLSSNERRDFITILDRLEELGYIIDTDIHNAEFFGVAQRRKRLFIVCQHINSILNRKTDSSRLIIAQCLTEILVSILVEARRESLIGFRTSDLPKMYSADGLRRRIKLFKMQSAEHLNLLLKNLAGVQVRSQNMPRNWELILGENATDTNQIQAEESFEHTLKEMGSLFGSWNTERLWKIILDECLHLMNTFITSTASRMITESEIYFCAMALLNTKEYIVQLNHLLHPYWSAEQSALIGLREFMNYARQSCRSMFGEMGWIQNWIYFIEQAEHTNEFGANLGNGSSSEVLFERESGTGNTPPSREAGKGVAYSLRSNPSRSGDKGDGGINTTLIAPTLSASAGGLNRPAGQGNEKDFVVADTLTSTYARNRGAQAGNASKVHNLFAFDANQNLRDVSEDVAPTLLHSGDGKKAHGAYPKLSVVMAHGQSNAEIVNDGEPSLTNNREQPILFEQVWDSAQITNKEHGSKPSAMSQPLNTSGRMMTGVRRLTPIECERLQGFPDRWTEYSLKEGMDDIAFQSDSARYRQLGNAVAVPVAEWIGRRIMECEKGG